MIRRTTNHWANNVLNIHYIFFLRKNNLDTVDCVNASPHLNVNPVIPNNALFSGGINPSYKGQAEKSEFPSRSRIDL